MLWHLPLGADWGPTVNIKENPPRASGMRRRNIPKHSVLLDKAWAREKVAGKSPAGLGEGKPPTPAHRSHSVTCKGAENRGKHLWRVSTQFGDTGSQTDRDLVTGPWDSFPCLILDHQITKGLFTTVPLPVHRVWLSRKIYKAYQKAKNMMRRDRANVRPRHDRDVEIIRLGI